MGARPEQISEALRFIEESTWQSDKCELIYLGGVIDALNTALAIPLRI